MKGNVFMKLKHECIRDILIYCEDTLSFGENLSWNPLYLEDFTKALPQYSEEDIAYTLLLLDEAQFINGNITMYSHGIYDVSVYRLTYTGHEFIDSIRPEPIWKKLLPVLTSLGSTSIPIIQNLASQFVLDYLNTL